MQLEIKEDKFFPFIEKEFESRDVEVSDVVPWGDEDYRIKVEDESGEQRTLNPSYFDISDELDEELHEEAYTGQAHNLQILMENLDRPPVGVDGREFRTLNIGDREHVLVDAFETLATGVSLEGPFDYTQMQFKEMECGDMFVWATTGVRDGEEGTIPGSRKIPHNKDGGYGVVADPDHPRVKTRSEEALYKLTDAGKEAAERMEDFDTISQQSNKEVQRMLENIYENEVEDMSGEREIYASILGDLLGNENEYTDSHIDWKDNDYGTFTWGDFGEYKESWRGSWRGCSDCAGPIRW